MVVREIELWSDAVEQARISGGWSRVRRAVVLRETASTQDAALMLGGREHGLLVVAGRQTRGRGRLGRAWADTSHKGIAATLTVEPSMKPERLSLAAGLASCRTIELMLASAGSTVRVGIRWPNDIVEVTAKGPGRKLSGVLIEMTPAIGLVGIGINVLQADGDWGPAMEARAISLRQLGASASRLDVLLALAAALEQAMHEPVEQLASEWQRRNVLNGTRQTFVHDGRNVTGEVVGIDPACSVRVQTESGVVELPALTTSLVH